MKRAMETWEKERILFKCILQKDWTHVLQVRDWWRKALVNTAMNLFLTSRVSNSLTIPRPRNEIYGPQCRGLPPLSTILFPFGRPVTYINHPKARPALRTLV